MRRMRRKKGGPLIFLLRVTYSLLVSEYFLSSSSPVIVKDVCV